MQKYIFFILSIFIIASIGFAFPSDDQFCYCKQLNTMATNSDAVGAMYCQMEKMMYTFFGETLACFTGEEPKKGFIDVFSVAEEDSPKAVPITNLPAGVGSFCTGTVHGSCPQGLFCMPKTIASDDNSRVCSDIQAVTQKEGEKCYNTMNCVLTSGSCYDAQGNKKNVFDGTKGICKLDSDVAAQTGVQGTSPAAETYGKLLFYPPDADYGGETMVLLLGEKITSGLPECSTAYDLTIGNKCQDEKKVYKKIMDAAREKTSDPTYYHIKKGNKIIVKNVTDADIIAKIPQLLSGKGPVQVFCDASHPAGTDGVCDYNPALTQKQAPKPTASLQTIKDTCDDDTCGVPALIAKGPIEVCNFWDAVKALNPFEIGGFFRIVKSKYQLKNYFMT